jgi:hypothetical protein
MITAQTVGTAWISVRPIVAVTRWEIIMPLVHVPLIGMRRPAERAGHGVYV